MTSRRFPSSARARPAAGRAKPMPDSQIDFSDITESTEAELKRARRVGRPKSGSAKQLIAIRSSPRLLARLRRLAARQSEPYQTLIHELLEKAAIRAA
jgi:predicted DNA binding CopG/RHH family protein